MLFQDSRDDLAKIVRFSTVDLYQGPSILAQALTDLPRYIGLSQAPVHAEFKQQDLEERLLCMPIHKTAAQRFLRRIELDKEVRSRQERQAVTNHVDAWSSCQQNQRAQSLDQAFFENEVTFRFLRLTPGLAQQGDIDLHAP